MVARSGGFAVLAVDVVERSTGQQRLGPVDQGDAVDLELVEALELEDAVVVAGCRVTVWVTPAASMVASLASINASSVDGPRPFDSSIRAALAS